MGPFVVLPVILLALAAVAGIVFGGFGAIRRRIAAPAQREMLTDGEGGTPESTAEEDWKEGDDLLHYPRRLSELETGLEQSLGELDLQVDHLEDRIAALNSKNGRQEIAQRYQQDLLLLRQRDRSMRRVLGLVWRTRAILELRAHLAITARQKPDLDDLPDVDVDIQAIDESVDAFEHAARRVRRFVAVIEDRHNELALVIPRTPPVADLSDELREEVNAELQRLEKTYGDLRERMDHLSDTLIYLADRCRTRRIVEGTTTDIDAHGGEAFIEEVNHALSDLNQLTTMGEVHLAESTLDALVEDISQLERAGLEVQAEADAAIEVARLLEHFPAR